MNKFLILLGTILVVSLFFWMFLGTWIDSPARFSDIGTWLNPLILFSLLASLLSIGFMMPIRRRLKLLFILAVFLPFWLFFSFDKLYLIAFGLLFLLQLFSITRFESEIGERIKFNIVLILKRGAPWIITSLLIIVSFAYFLSPDIQALAESGELPTSFKKVLGGVIDGFFGDQSGINNDVVKKEVESETASFIKSRFSKYFGLLPPIMAFGMFLILQGLSFIFIWVVIGLSVLFFWIMRKANIISLAKTKKDAEVIKL